MGGFGSGRPKSETSRRVVDEFVSVDIRDLPTPFALGLPHTSGMNWHLYGRGRIHIRVESMADRLVFSVEHRSAGRPPTRLSQALSVTATPCRYGGERAWLLCPDCGRRVAIVYWVALRFSCRHCKRLSYASQREPVDLRALRRLDRLRRRLGWPSGALMPPGVKPNGMHWRTYRRLVTEHNKLLEVFGRGLSDRVDALSDVLRDIRARIE